MDTAETNRAEEIKREWTDQYVRVNAQYPELKRFEENLAAQDARERSPDVDPRIHQSMH